MEREDLMKEIVKEGEKFAIHKMSELGKTIVHIEEREDVKEAVGKLVDTFYNIMREHGLRWGTKTECGTQGANFEWTLAKDAFIFRVTSLMEWQMLFGDPEDLKHYEQED